MREILFRGRTTKGAEWVSGFYAEYSTAPFIGAPNPQGTMLWFEVDPETVGQFTGLTDHNGKRIFEGDIVHVHDCLLKPSAPYHEFDGVIEHRNGSFVIVDEIITHYRWLDYDVTVLGNIHDNPEVLEVESDAVD